MEIVFNILESLPSILFWSAVLSFVPTAYYLLIQNPPIYKAERMRAKGIFVMGEEKMVHKAGKTRVRTIFLIYGICLTFFSVIYFFNSSHHRSGVNPFDILSSLSVILFGFSIITYLPLAFYLISKDPWRDREEGLCLTGLFISYGIGIVLFAIVFAWHWLKAHQLPVKFFEIFSSLLIGLFSSIVIAYLPTSFYVYRQIANPYRPRRIHSKAIFVIYSICFLVFASTFIINWVSDKRSGVEVSRFQFKF